MILRKLSFEEIIYLLKDFNKATFKMKLYSVLKTDFLECNKKINYIKEEEELLKLIYDLFSNEDLGILFGRTTRAIQSKGYRLNLANKHSEWTDEENDYLLNNWGEIPITSIKKYISNKSTVSIYRHAIKLGLKQLSYYTEVISIGDIEKMLQVPRKTIRSKWVKKGLIIKREKLYEKKYIYGCLLEDLLEFLENNQDLFDSRNLEQYALTFEPDWLIEKRKQDYINPPVIYHELSSDEIDNIISLLKKNYTYGYISDVTKRGKKTIAKIAKINNLQNEHYTLGRKENKEKLERMKLVLSLYSEGHSRKEIQDITGISEPTVRRYIKTLEKK